MADRVLVVSKNEILKKNIEKWYSARMKDGSLIVDYAGSNESANKMMSINSYDEIFHNGIYIIPAIERLQSGANVHGFGKTNNNYNNFIENSHDKKGFSKVFSKKYLKLGVNIGGALGSVVAIITGLALVIAFGLYIRTDVDVNTEGIGRVNKKVDNLEVKVDENGVVSRENNVILKIVYGEELEKILPKNNKSTIGD